MVNPSDIVRRAAELANKNPEKARSLIDALEDKVDQVTGGRYAGQVDQAGDFVEGRLGLGQPGADPQAPAADQAQPPADRAQPPADRAQPPAAGAAPAGADPAQAQADESVQG